MLKEGIKKRFLENIRLWADGLNHLIWPNKCIICGSYTDPDNKFLCTDCWRDLMASVGSDHCPQCGKDISKYGILEGRCPSCMGQEFYFDRLIRTGAYKGVFRNLILSFKNGRSELHEKLGRLVNSVVMNSGVAGAVDLFVPVPLFWLRRLKRGYNQSYLIAKHLNGKISTDLVRVRNTPYQTVMASPAKRAANVKNAFGIRKGHKFEGKTVCLVDDIKTTGATLNECSRVLKSSGALRVYAVVLAVAGQQKN